MALPLCKNQESGLKICSLSRSLFNYLFPAVYMDFYKDQQVSLIAGLVSIAEGTGNILY